MRVLVTGGAGFIGSHIVDALVERGCDVTIFDSFDPQVHGDREPAWLNPAATLVRGDVRDYDALAEVALAADVIFHKAAAVGVGQSQYQIKHYVDVNVGGTANLLDILAQHPDHPVKKLIVAASMSSYGEGLYLDSAGAPVRPALRTAADVAGGRWDPRGSDGLPLTPTPTPEREAQHVSSVYSLSKRDQEDLVLNFGRTHDLPVVALRYFNVYGTRQSLSNPYTGVAAIFTSCLKSDNAPTIFEDGLQSRDFVSVHDVVAANMLAMESSGADGMSINIGAGQPVTIVELARILARALGKDIEPDVRGGFRKGDIRHCFPDLTLARERLGYAPSVALEDGIREYIEWARDEECEDRSAEATRELAERGLLGGEAATDGSGSKAGDSGGAAVA